MVSEERINELLEAYEHYTECGIIVHPLEAPTIGDHTTGKTPKLGGWNVRKMPYTEREIMPFIKSGCNLGIVCGKASDITVIDIDWYNTAIINYLLEGLDTSQWILQKRQDSNERGHIIFRFEPELAYAATTHQELGFDILSHNLMGKSNNCVCAPSIHYTGQQYKMNKDISERPQMPSVLVQRIKNILTLYDEIKDILKNCRAPFRNFWESMFNDKASEIYHKSIMLFRGSLDNRTRSLGMFTELKANGATTEHLLLCCMLAFGSDFKETHCRKEISHLDVSKTWTNTKIQKDEYLSKFYVGLNFDPFTAPFEKMEKMLKPESMDAYENIMLSAPYECLDLVRRAFLVGVFTKGGYIREFEKDEEVSQIEVVAPGMKEIWKHGEKVIVSTNRPESKASSAEEIKAFIEEMEEEEREKVTVDPVLKEEFYNAFKGGKHNNL